MFAQGSATFVRIWELGNDIINFVAPVSTWLNNTYTIPILHYNGDIWFTAGTIEASMTELLLGTGLVGMLGFKFVKWVVDIVL